MELIKLNAAEYGLEETKAQEIAAQFRPMLDKMEELEKEFNEVINIPIDTPEAAKKAKELRLKYVKVRTGTAEIHKKQKAFYLAGGRFVDGWKNAQLFASEGKEEKLSEIENYAETKERERINKLREEREKALEPYEVDTSALMLGMMTEQVWENFLAGAKIAYQARKEAEAKAEAERIAAEKAIQLHNDRKNAVVSIWIYLDCDTSNFSVYSNEEWEEILAKANAKRDKEREENERIRKEREELEQKLKLEREQAEVARKELEAKRAEEARIEAERLANIERERKEAERLAKAPIKKQLSAWVNSFELPATEIQHMAAEEIKSKFESFKNWAKQIAEGI